VGMIWNSKDFARDDARNEYLCRWTWESVASATNGEGHADADAEYLLPVKKERHTFAHYPTLQRQQAPEIAARDDAPAGRVDLRR
jgi:hypothetical protein